MFIIGIILLLFALCFISIFNDNVRCDWLRYDQKQQNYNELRAQGIQSNEIERPEIPKTNHNFYELTFVVLIVLAILFMAYPEQSTKILSKIPRLFLWFYFGPH